MLAERGAAVRPISGGTDVMVMIKDGVLKEKELLDLSRLEELRYIKEDGELIRIGARTTYREVERSPVINAYAPILVEASKTIGSVQIQNLGTIAGNLGNASPAADSVPSLYVLEARVKLASVNSEREVGIGEFFLGPRKTVRRPDELITEVSFRKMEPGSHFFFKKLGLRSANAISIVSAAGILKLSNGKIDWLRLALGAVAPTVIRSPTAEERARGAELNEDSIRAIAEGASTDARPITDIRGTAEYRKKAVFGLVYEALYEIMSGSGKRVVFGLEGRG